MAAAAAVLAAVLPALHGCRRGQPEGVVCRMPGDVAHARTGAEGVVPDLWTACQAGDEGWGEQLT